MVDSMPRVSRSKLLSVLKPFDRQLSHRVLLIAVGGTAMTLLGIKASTKDIDFNIPSEADYNEFNKLYKRLRPGVVIDYYSSNMIFTEVLPGDYINRVSAYRSNFKNIEVKILHPLDIICSKISRSNDADMEDMKSCIKAYRIRKGDIAKRARLYERAGSGRVFRTNLKIVLETLF